MEPNKCFYMERGNDKTIEYRCEYWGKCARINFYDNHHDGYCESKKPKVYRVYEHKLNTKEVSKNGRRTEGSREKETKAKG